MGDIIRLPVMLAEYPDTSETLDPAASVLLIAIRVWVDAQRRDEEPMLRLSEELEIAGAPDAALSIDAVMTIVAQTVQRPIAVHCPGCPHLSTDEKHLLHAASLVQAHNEQLAEKALRDALLSAPGAEFALGPLQGLGELFADARLFFRR